jgi:hypothetical protein
VGTPVDEPKAEAEAWYVDSPTGSSALPSATTPRQLAAATTATLRSWGSGIGSFFSPRAGRFSNASTPVGETTPVPRPVPEARARASLPSNRSLSARESVATGHPPGSKYGEEVQWVVRCKGG